MHNSIYMCLIGVQCIRFTRTSGYPDKLSGIMSLILLVKFGLAEYPIRREHEHVDNLVKRRNPPASLRKWANENVLRYCRCIIHRFEARGRMYATATDNLTSAEDLLFDQLKSMTSAVSTWALGSVPAFPASRTHPMQLQKSVEFR